jgi:spore coat protein CotF
MKLTQKETSILEDLKSQEQVCIEKYDKYAESASDGQLKGVFEDLGKTEREHLDTITQIMSGTVPNVPQTTSTSKQQKQPPAAAPKNAMYNKNDSFLCKDALAMEKHVSSTYNVGIFEFRDPQTREMLNHIQKEEQEHGEILYCYMAQTGMYPTE